VTGPKLHPPGPRFALVSSPRSGNTWLRRMLAALFGLQERAVHTPGELGWDGLPPRSILQLHWPADPAFVAQLEQHGFHVVVLVRHPLDTLISILHFATHEPQTTRWLDGAHGDERSILGAEPCSQRFVAYATGPRAGALVGVSGEWSQRHDVTLVRFEDLVNFPARELQRIVERPGVRPVISVEEAIETVSFARMRHEANNQHFWQGQPGLWRHLLPPEYAQAVSGPYRAHAARHRYELTPDPALTLDAARLEWAVRGGNGTSANGAVRVAPHGS
jgi:hypothetical protein